MMGKFKKLSFSFQTAPRGHFNGSMSSALARISVAGSLIQSFLSDSLDAHGLGKGRYSTKKSADFVRALFLSFEELG